MDKRIEVAAIIRAFNDKDYYPIIEDILIAAKGYPIDWIIAMNKKGWIYHKPIDPNKLRRFIGDALNDDKQR